MNKKKIEELLRVPRVAIIILNWNGWKDTIECLESLYQIIYPNYEVIVVDNGSIDESIQKIKEYCEGKIEVESKLLKYDASNKPIKIIEHTRLETTSIGKESELEITDSNKKLLLIKNEKNYGFAEGNNIAIRFVINNFDSEFFLLLNNDTVVDNSFLSELVKTAKADSKIGIVGPMIYYYDYNGRSDVINFLGSDLILWKGCEKRYGYKELDKGQYEKIKEVDKIEGSCMLIKKKIIEDVGYFDSKFFAYWEETDLCYRAKIKKFKCICNPKSKIWHKISSSSSSNNSSLKWYYRLRNQFWFMKKNIKNYNYVLFILYFFIYKFWFLLFKFIFHERDIKKVFILIKSVKDGLNYSYIK